jgi:ribosome biogenesis GTPase
MAAFGWSARVDALYAAIALAGAEPARVVRVERSACVVVAADGRERVVPASDLPAVGDWVAVSGSALGALLPRWSALTRVDPSGGVQVLAVNVDLVLITAPADRLSAARVERELAVAWASGAQPVVVLTKSDIEPASVRASLEERLVGVDVVRTSAATGAGVAEIRARLRPARTAVLLGPSGAGKSTLANALAGAEVLATGAVREHDSRGRHTTTSRQMIALPGGGVLIDTPGLRSLGLGGEVDVLAAFPEIAALVGSCRFDDCRHQTEPGCAVTAALERGDLRRDRLGSYRKLDLETRSGSQTPERSGRRRRHREPG